MVLPRGSRSANRKADSNNTNGNKTTTNTNKNDSKKQQAKEQMQAPPQTEKKSLEKDDMALNDFVMGHDSGLFMFHTENNSNNGNSAPSSNSKSKSNPQISLEELSHDKTNDFQKNEGILNLTSNTPSIPPSQPSHHSSSFTKSTSTKNTTKNNNNTNTNSKRSFRPKTSSNSQNETEVSSHHQEKRLRMGESPQDASGVLFHKNEEKAENKMNTSSFHNASLYNEPGAAFRNQNDNIPIEHESDNKQMEESETAFPPGIAQGDENDNKQDQTKLENTNNQHHQTLEPSHSGNEENEDRREQEDDEDDEPDWNVILQHEPAKTDAPVFLAARDRRDVADERFAAALDQCHAVLKQCIEDLLKTAANIHNMQREKLDGLEIELKDYFTQNEENRVLMEKRLQESATAAQGLFAQLLMRVSQPIATATKNLNRRS